MFNIYVTIKNADIASFNNGEDANVKYLLVNITPTQSGSGDPAPDNERHISGWEDAKIVVSPTLDAQDGTMYSASWQNEAGTVYGGTLDVITGLLTVTRVMVDAGTLTWGKNTALTNAFSGVLAPQGNLVATNPFAIMCSKYKTAENIISVGQLPDLCITGSINDANTFRFIFIRDSNYAEAWNNNTPGVFKAALRGVQVSYVLNEPQIYQLTPTEVKTLLGVNNIWANTGKITITYKAKGEANMDNLGGYILFDCGGLNLNTSNEQTITGIYDKAKEAISKGKPIIVTNCVMGTAPCTPTSVIAWQDDADTIIATGHVLRIAIDEDDGVTVTNLVAG